MMSPLSMNQWEKRTIAIGNRRVKAFLFFQLGFDSQRKSTYTIHSLLLKKSLLMENHMNSFKKILFAACVLFLSSTAAAIADNMHALCTDLETPIQLSFFAPAQTSTIDYDVNGLRVNLLYGKNRNVKGLDLGLVNHTSESMLGIQLGFVNVVEKEMTGLQDAYFVNSCQSLFGKQSAIANFCSSEAKGIQLGVYNNAYSVNGVQLGLLNTTHSMQGLQWGLINYTHHLSGVQIGLVNVQSERTYIKALPLINVSW